MCRAPGKAEHLGEFGRVYEDCERGGGAEEKVAFVWEVVEGQGSGGERLSQSVDRVEPIVQRDVGGADGHDVGPLCQIVHGVGDARTDQVDTLNVLYRRGQVEDVAVS